MTKDEQTLIERIITIAVVHTPGDTKAMAELNKLIAIYYSHMRDKEKEEK